MCIPSIRDGRYTLTRPLIVAFTPHTGHIRRAVNADLMQFLQNIWPHLVVVSSTEGPMHIGHIMLGSFGDSGAFVAFSI
jgi:hypothetical protein